MNTAAPKLRPSSVPTSWRVLAPGRPPEPPIQTSLHASSAARPGCRQEELEEDPEEPNANDVSLTGP